MDDLVEYLRWLRDILPSESNIIAYSWLCEHTHYYIEDTGREVPHTFTGAFKIDKFIKKLVF